jgi:hypothetical protein
MHKNKHHDTFVNDVFAKPGYLYFLGNFFDSATASADLHLTLAPSHPMTIYPRQLVTF